MSKWHEVRLCGLLILVDRFVKQATKRLEYNAEAIKKRDKILTFVHGRQRNKATHRGACAMLRFIFIIRTT